MILEQPFGTGEFPDALRLRTTDPAEQPAVDRYHRWLAEPDADSPAAVASGLGAYAPLVDVVAYTVGLADAPPADDRDLPAELRALVLSAQAAAAIDSADRGELERAVALLESADLPPEAGLAATRAELHHALGGLAHEEAAAAGEPLTEAMGHYYAALRLVSEASAPLLWAALQLDLATAQLASPMKEATDQLRIGVAAQALRASRRVFTPEQQPGPWSMATLNLANALVYLPSTHQGDNLVEAVELYEEVLASGIRDGDTGGRARLLANQGNALAHLGIFDQAGAKLAEARFLFESVLDHEGALLVRQVQDEIARASVVHGEEDDELAALARKAEQMSRMPAEHTDARTSGMGVAVVPGAVTPPEEAQRRAKVTVLDRHEAGDRS